MLKFIADTQAIEIFLNGQTVINKNIDKIFCDTDQGKNIIINPSMVIAEIGYPNEKGRIPISIEFKETILNSSIIYVEEPLSIDIIKTSFEITDIPELYDKLIAGTARYLQIPILTNDPLIFKNKFVDTFS